MESIHHSKRCLEYTMQINTLNRHTRKNRNHCRKCGLAFNVNDRVVRKFGAGYKPRLFHKECAEELNVI